MAECFPSNEAAANGFGRCSLCEQESWLLFEANIPVPPDMRAEPAGWRLSNGGVPIPPLPDAMVRAPYFAAEVENSKGRHLWWGVPAARSRAC